MTTNIASLFDLSGRSSSSYLTSGGSFREKFGEGLFTEEQKRIRQYADQDINQQSNVNMRRLEAKKTEAVEMSDPELVASTGSGRNRSARSVEQSFGPMDNSVAFRLNAPIRA
jgi:hypothetical protein